MKHRIAVAQNGVTFPIQEVELDPRIYDEVVYEIKASPMIDRSCFYTGDDKSKNQPWKRRGKL